MAKRGTNRNWGTDEQKAQILIEAEKAESVSEYARQHGINPLTFLQMRKRFFRSHPDFDPTTAPSSPAPKPLTTPNGLGKDKAALLAEYDTLPRGQARPWLEQHNISRQTIYDWRYELKRGINRKSHRSTAPPPLPPSPSHPPPSLDDAINAFKVERDMLNTTIEKLERMRAGKF